MRSRFNTIDIIAILNELQSKIGMRVNKVYDIDTKTYLIKLTRGEEKTTLLLESGIRIHSTEYDWPKNPTPSGFSMKLRKHLKNKRLEKISQLGIDRIVDLQFGSGEYECHLILELYDRGNIVLTNNELLILNILRPRTLGNEDVKLVVREHYPISSARQKCDPLSPEAIKTFILEAKTGDHLKKILNPHVIYGSLLLDHVLKAKGLQNKCIVGKTFDMEKDLDVLIDGLNLAEQILNNIIEGRECKGYIIQKVEKSVSTKEIITFKDFCPIKFLQFEDEEHQEFPSFDKAVDVYFSSLESQKIDMKVLHKEKEALKKLENIKKDHFQRINNLQKSQDADCFKAQLIEMNLEVVDRAIYIIANAIANQASWTEIEELIQEAQAQGEPVSRMIKGLKLQINHFTMALTNPYENDSSEDDSDDENNAKKSKCKPVLVDIDIDLSAYANARKYYDKKKNAAKKEQKTIESSAKAYKSAEKKTKQALKEVAITTHIIKSRKTYWFEKFLWFISSENYLVIAGRDVQQNELIVKRYLKPGDIYVHADLHGATSLVVKNPSKKPVPPKTLNEAGTMAICYSSAWESKIITSAWWVHHHQVSKTAPTGEYLTTGSFMIRGKKNFLLPSHLILGYGFLFKLDEDSLERHKDDRKIKVEEEELKSSLAAFSMAEEDVEIHLSENSDDDEDAEGPTQAKEEIKKEATELPGIKEVVEEDEEERKSNEEGEFPDTAIDLMPSVRTEARVFNNKSSMEEPVVVHKTNKSKEQNSKKGQVNQEKSSDFNKQQPKRGQKSKMKKIKEKYKDQDEEEREIRLKLLGSAGESKKAKKQKELQSKSKQIQLRHKNKANATICIHTETQAAVDVKEDQKPVVTQELQDDDSDPENPEEESKANEDEMLLQSLTGCPLPEDSLLYAVPVCAPYSCLLNYKFKVKVMPGTAKRGKAAKRALHMFIQDKATTSLEKDLLKSVKDQDIYRNMPGKVKLAAPNLNKIR